jgi:hypothetical protein
LPTGRSWPRQARHTASKSMTAIRKRLRQPPPPLTVGGLVTQK